MSENLNIDDVTVANHDLLIPCVVESLESIHSNKPDCNFKNILSTNDCNSAMDIGEPVGNCEEIDSLVLTENNGMSNTDLGVENVQKSTGDKLLDVGFENTSQINVDVIGCMDDANVQSLSDVQDKIIETNSAIDETIVEHIQIVDEHMTGKLCLMIIYYSILFNTI